MSRRTETATKATQKTRIGSSIHGDGSSVNLTNATKNPMATGTTQDRTKRMS